MPGDINEKRIALWPAKNRGRGPNNPHLVGKTVINGKKYSIVLWKRNRDSPRQPILSGEITEINDDDLEV